MRIIGGHDYYDGVVPFDTDRSHVFLRDGRELDLPQPIVPTLYVDQFTGKQWQHDLDVIEVIFCGKRYRGMRLSRYLRNGGEAPEAFHFWSSAKLRAFMTETGMSFQKRPKYRWHCENDRNVYDDNLEDFFFADEVEPDLFKRLVAERVLIAVAPIKRPYGRDNAPWKVNCDGLRELHFSAVVEPWAAYQELDMFLGTILVGDEDRMVKVSDETKLRKYGFDGWSFKNAVHAGKPRGRSAR